MHNEDGNSEEIMPAAPTVSVTQQDQDRQHNRGILVKLTGYFIGGTWAGALFGGLVGAFAQPSSPVALYVGMGSGAVVGVATVAATNRKKCQEYYSYLTRDRGAEIRYKPTGRSDIEANVVVPYEEVEVVPQNQGNPVAASRGTSQLSAPSMDRERE